MRSLIILQRGHLTFSLLVDCEELVTDGIISHTASRISRRLEGIRISYTSLVFVAAELPQDVLSVGGAYADLRKTRQPLGHHIQLGSHLKKTETLETVFWFFFFWIEHK